MIVKLQYVLVMEIVKQKMILKTINDEVDEVCYTYLEMRYAQKKIIVITKDKDGKKKEFDLVHEDFRLLCDNLNKRTS